MIGWEVYNTMISFLSKGFPYKDQTEELFIVYWFIVCISNTSHCQLSRYFHFFDCNILFNGTV